MYAEQPETFSFTIANDSPERDPQIWNFWTCRTTLTYDSENEIVSGDDCRVARFEETMGDTRLVDSSTFNAIRNSTIENKNN